MESNIELQTEKTLPNPKQVIEKLPLSKELEEQVKKDRQEIINILKGEDKRKLLITGPCSAWPDTAVIDYAKQLSEIAEKVKDKIKIIIRVYTQKPRTTLGWQGSLIQPDPFEDPDIEKGIFYCRKMMIEILKLGLPIADEFLFTHSFGYFTDLLSWAAIGARSSEDQEHRVFASLFDFPVGIKNPTSGNIEIGINSVISAQNSHHLLLNNQQIKTSGNSYAHLILRGGNNQPNIDLENLKKSSQILKEQVKNPGIIIDLSHDNSIDPKTGKKDPLQQPKVLSDVLKLIKQEELTTIKGFMLESFIKTGNQDINNLEEINKQGLSITDACLGIQETKDLINEFYKFLN